MKPSDLDFDTLWLNFEMRVMNVGFLQYLGYIECRLLNSTIGIEQSCGMCKKEGFEHWVVWMNFRVYKQSN